MHKSSFLNLHQRQSNASNHKGMRKIISTNISRTFDLGKVSKIKKKKLVEFSPKGLPPPPLSGKNNKI